MCGGPGAQGRSRSWDVATGDLRHEVGDESDREEADDEAGETALGAWQDGALAAGKAVDALAHDLRGGLDATALKGPGAGDPEEFALRGPGTEGSDFDAVARDLSSKAQCEEAVECLGAA